MLDNYDKINNIKTLINESANYFLDIANEIVDSYCHPVDMLMQEIRQKLDNENSALLTDDQLEVYNLKLANHLYFIGRVGEASAIKADLAKANRLQVYNKTYLETTGTAGQKEAIALTSSEYESMMENVYNRSAKMIKQCCDAGYEMLASIKKTMDKRRQQNDLAAKDFTSKVSYEEI